MPFTEDFYHKTARLKRLFETADAILIGAGAGLSSSAGFTYTGERFRKYFSDFQKKYRITDMYTGGFYPFEDPETYWAWWSRQIYYNRYAVEIGKPYRELLSLVREKNYFVLTTNVDHQFRLAGFDKERLFCVQGNYGLFQCSVPCHEKTYDNKEAVARMVEEQKDMRIPTALIPRCPRCGRPMTVNLRCDERFVQDAGWYAACRRYEDFVGKYGGKRLLLLELGVGYNTPSIIKYPFWQMTRQNPDAVYAVLNQEKTALPTAIQKQAIFLQEDIGTVLSFLLERG